MAAFPSPFSRWAALAGACACVCAASAADPAGAPAPAPRRFGWDSARFYAHAGLSGYLSGGSPSGAAAGVSKFGYPNTALQALIQAHAFRLEARVGVGSSYPYRDLPAERGTGEGSRFITVYDAGLSEASLGLRLGPAGTDQGMRIGLMPIQGDPEAILFGNYIARYQPYPLLEARGPRPWDSLGALAPKAAGIRLALGRADGPLRAEGLLVKDDPDYSWLAYLSGRAPRGIRWGLGMSGYRVLNPDRIFDSNGEYRAAPTRDTAGSAVFAGDYIESYAADTVYFSYASLLFSGRASLDFASLFAPGAPAGGSGGVFAEAALLGWKEYPYSYPDRWRRFLWTAGARIPTFGWLDACVAQVEWRRPQESILTGAWNGSWIPTPTGYGNNAIPSVDSSGAGPGYAGPSTPRRASPWGFGLLLARGFGPHAAFQARLLAFESEQRYADPVRQVNALARILFRFH